MSQSPTSANTVRILYEPQEYMKYSINYVFELNLQDNALRIYFIRIHAIGR